MHVHSQSESFFSSKNATTLANWTTDLIFFFLTITSFSPVQVGFSTPYPQIPDYCQSFSCTHFKALVITESSKLMSFDAHLSCFFHRSITDHNHCWPSRSCLWLGQLATILSFLLKLTAPSHWSFYSFSKIRVPGGNHSCWLSRTRSTVPQTIVVDLVPPWSCTCSFFINT